LKAKIYKCETTQANIYNKCEKIMMSRKIPR